MPKSPRILAPLGRYRRFNPYSRYDRRARQLRHDRSTRHKRTAPAIRARLPRGDSDSHQLVPSHRNLQQHRIILAAFTSLALCVAAAHVARADGPTTDPFASTPFVLPVASYQPAVDAPFRDDVSQPVMVDHAPTNMGASPTPPVPLEPHQYELNNDSANCNHGNVGSDLYDDGVGGARAKQYPDNWYWGCGGSPYRDGPGTCDDWKVGPVWDVAVDGMTLFHRDADLAAIEAIAIADGAPDSPLTRENQFNYGGGARVSAIDLLPIWPNYQLQFVYEGIPEWNADVIFPDVGLIPPPSAPDLTQTETIHYRTIFHSAEFNFYRRPIQVWRPFWGVRYLRWKDDLSDIVDQTTDPPVAGPMPIAAVTEDMSHYIEVNNNLMGFQVGLREDGWQLNKRFSLQGFVNAGVYYNQTKFNDERVTTTTTLLADDTDTINVSEAGSSSNVTSRLVSSQPTDIAYVAEASLTGVCRLNRCCALRGGYQFLWIDGVHIAQDAFTNQDLGGHDFLLQGWHVGIECRR